MVFGLFLEFSGTSMIFWAAFLVEGGILNLHLIAEKGVFSRDWLGDYTLVLPNVSYFSLPPN